jgi:hypothetical protein
MLRPTIELWKWGASEHGAMHAPRLRHRRSGNRGECSFYWSAYGAAADALDSIYNTSGGAIVNNKTYMEQADEEEEDEELRRYSPAAISSSHAKA